MKCPVCGRENPDDAVFCIYCGANLNPTKVRKPLGERKLVTVLFADIVGFTTMSEELDPEEVLKIINTFFEKLEEPVRKYEGTIDKYMGDAVMVVFGAPLAHENDSERAVYTALEMQRISKEFSKKVDKKIRLSIGINTGLVVTGEVGGKEKALYSVIGDTVNVAKRVQEFAGPGDIIVTESVYHLTNYLFDYQEIGTITVKGRRQPVKVFKVLNHKTTSSKDAYIKGKLVPFIGREEELEKIIERKDYAFLKKKGQIVVISGEPGIGKSRLKFEIKNSVDRNNVFVFEGKSAPHTKHIPYWPIIEILKTIFEIDEFDTKDVIKEKLEKQSKKFNLDQENLEAIMEIIGLSEVSSYEFKQLKFAVWNIIKKLSEIKPIMLIFEDIHWMDISSLEILSYLAEAIKDVPVLMVLITRSGFLPEIPVSYNVLNIYLKPFTMEESKDFAAKLLGVVVLPEEFADVVLKKSEGNPFFIEQIVSHLVDRGYIEVKNRSLIIKKEIREEDIPHSIHSIISAEIDRLPRDLKEIVKKASVIGREFNVEILKKLAEEENIEDLLLTLQGKGIIYRSRTQANTFIFKHTFIRDVAYNMLLKSEKKYLHTRIAYILEELYQDRIDEYTDLISYHLLEGKAYQKALNYMLKSAEKDTRLHLFKSASQKYDTITKVVEALNKEGTNVPHNVLFRVYLGKGRVSEYLGLWDRAQKEYSKAMEYAKMVDNSYGIIDATCGMARVLYLKGFVDQSFKRAEYAKKQSEELNYKVGLAESLYIIGQINQLKGNISESLELIEKSMSIFEEIGYKGRQIELSIRKSYLCTIIGEYKESLKTLRDALQIAKERDDKYSIGRILGEVARVEILKNRSEYARGVAKGGLQYLSEIGDLGGQAELLNILADSYLRESEYGEALSVLRKALDIYRQIGEKKGLAHTMSKIAEILFYYIGDKDESLAYLKQCSRIQKSMDDRLGLAYSYLRLSDLYAHNGQFSISKNFATRAKDIGEEGGIKSIYIRGLSRIAEIEFFEGKYDEAQRLLGTAYNTMKKSKVNIQTQMDFYKRAVLIYSVLGKYDKAENYIQEFEAIKDIPKDIFSASVLMEKARYFVLSGKYKKAKEHVFDLFSRVFNFENKELYSISMILKGLVIAELEDYTKGKESVEEGITLGFLFLSPFDLALSQFLYGKVALAHGDREGLLLNFTNAVEISKTNNIVPILGLVRKFKEKHKGIDIML